jgi:RNA polymerase sigma factor (sigma-70 family)
MPPQKDFHSLDVAGVIDDLIRRHGDKWLRFVTRLLGSSEDAEDVMQEAVRRVLLRDHPFRSTEEVRLYLGRAIRNTAIETYHIRKRERARRLPLREQWIPSQDSRDPHSYLEHREQSDETRRLVTLLEEGLARLPQKQCEAVRLTLLAPECTSIREAGAEQGIPYSTLRHRCVQGMRNLRKYIKKALRSKPVKLLLMA